MSILITGAGLIGCHYARRVVDSGETVVLYDLSPNQEYVSKIVEDLLSTTTELRDKLEENTRYFRERITTAGFEVKPGIHPIVPIMLYDAKLAKTMANELLKDGVYVVGFSYPVVPKGGGAHSRPVVRRPR